MIIKPTIGRMIIKPTIGRVVWYFPSPGDADFMSLHSAGPLAAIVAHVASDTCVNLAVFDSTGQSYSRTSITLHHDDGPHGAPYCAWMPLQKGQASKAEALEAKFAAETRAAREARVEGKVAEGPV